MYLYFCFLIHSKNYWWASVNATWTAYFFMESKHRKIALMTKQKFECRSLFIEKRVWFWTACSSRFIECATTLLNRNVSIGSLLVPGKTYSSFFSFLQIIISNTSAIFAINGGIVLSCSNRLTIPSSFQ